MTKVQNPKQYNFEDRTLAFAKKVRTFVKKLSKTIANIEDGKQANSFEHWIWDFEVVSSFDIRYSYLFLE